MSKRPNRQQREVEKVVDETIELPNSIPTFSTAPYVPGVELAKRNILVAVPSCAADKPLEEACKATWAKMPTIETPDSIAVIQFFNGRLLQVADDYDSLPIKIQAICRWALEHAFDFLFKCDVDTYVWIERLLYSGFEKHDYSGYTNPKFPDKENYCSGGAGYWLSKRAMKIVALADLTSDTCEDRWVGRVLYDAGVRIHRNPLHAHGRHEELGKHEFLTMHPCRSLKWMQEMQKW